MISLLFQTLHESIVVKGISRQKRSWEDAEHLLQLIAAYSLCYGHIHTTPCLVNRVDSKPPTYPPIRDLGFGLSPHICEHGLRWWSTHRVGMAFFWRAFHNDGKISPPWWGWGVHALPLSLYLQHGQSCGVRSSCESRYIVQCHYFSTTPMCTLWLRTPDKTGSCVI